LRSRAARVAGHAGRVGFTLAQERRRGAEGGGREEVVHLRRPVGRLVWVV